jgi:hypothetical protein
MRAHSERLLGVIASFRRESKALLNKTVEDPSERFGMYRTVSEEMSARCYF